MSTITEFANELYENSRAKGFYDHEDRLRALFDDSYMNAVDQDFARTTLSEHFGNRLLLIAGEAVEAHEELRAGRGVGELYFSGKNRHGEEQTSDYHLHPQDGTLLKPEGVLAELADVAIRSLETIAGILANLSDEEAQKLRDQVPDTEHTTYTMDAVHNRSRTGKVDPVNVAEILNLKHEFNLSRAPKHGGKAF